MPRRPIVPHVEARGGEAGEAGEAARDALRDAFARWASGVGVLALRHEGTVHAMTVTAFVALSLDPPLLGVAVGLHTPLAALLEPDRRFGLSVLGADQRRWAGVFADVFAVDRSGFPAAGDPVLAGALATLSGRVLRLEPVGDHGLLIGAVERAQAAPERPPLVYFQRTYRGLDQGETWRAS
jgi:flavin reductase (DIM6/NTAB) family NADH-FMN oxidoreductase RutF